MTSLAKKTAVVAFMGIGAFTVCSFLPRWNADDRYDAAMTRLDADCRAYRRATIHRYSEVCRPYDIYAPHAFGLQRGMEKRLDDARSAFARGDRTTAETALRSTLSFLPELDAIGTLAAALAGAYELEQTLDLIEAHPEVDRRALLRDVYFELGHHPLEGEMLQRRWGIAHADTHKSKDAIADELEAETQPDSPARRAKLDLVVRTGQRLDAMRR